MRLSKRAFGALAGLLVGAFIFVPGVAMAGGLELSGTGARGMARGGATLAKAEDANVLSHNPAGLAELRGTMMMGDLNVTMLDACVEPIGYYGWGVYGGGDPAVLTDPDTGEQTRLPLGETESTPDGTVSLGDPYYNDPLDTVCLEHAAFPVPQFGITHRASKNLGFGFGLIFPPVTPSGRWGGENGVIHGDDGDLRPSPVRYMQVSSGNVGVFPTLGVGYRLTDWLRLGTSLQWGILSVHQQMMVPLATGTSPAGDVLVDVSAVDWFVPAAIFSAHVVPVDALDVVASFKMQDKVRTSGKVKATTGLFDPGAIPHVNRGLKLDRVEQALPWKAALGVRYASRLAPRPSGTGQFEGNENERTIVLDAMSEEAWDVEFDLEYQFNSMVDDIQVEAATGQEVEIHGAGGGPPGTQPFPDAGLEVITIEKKWQDQVVARLGGSWNIFPGVLGLHAGAHYETRGVTPAYMNVDFWPVERIGLHGGFTVRLDRRIDLTFAYGHIFQETIRVAAPAENTTGGPDNFSKVVGKPLGGPLPVKEEMNAPSNPDGTAALHQEETKVLPNRPPVIVNSGIYRSNIDVVAVGIQYHF